MSTKTEKEYYSIQEIADLYGKDPSHVAKEIKNLELETTNVRKTEGSRPIQALTSKALNKLVSTLKWSDVSISTKEISLTDAMRELGLHVVNQRKTFISKLVDLKITTTVKSLGKGKAQPCFDKKHLKELKDFFVIPVLS